MRRARQASASILAGRRFCWLRELALTCCEAGGLETGHLAAEIDVMHVQPETIIGVKPQHPDARPERIPDSWDARGGTRP